MKKVVGFIKVLLIFSSFLLTGCSAFSKTKMMDTKQIMENTVETFAKAVWNNDVEAQLELMPKEMQKCLPDNGFLQEEKLMNSTYSKYGSFSKNLVDQYMEIEILSYQMCTINEWKRLNNCLKRYGISETDKAVYVKFRIIEHRLDNMVSHSGMRTFSAKDFHAVYVFAIDAQWYAITTQFMVSDNFIFYMP